MCQSDCACQKMTLPLSVQLRKSEIQHVEYEGADYIVVPVILARSDVVMNGALLPADQYEPAAWNGVPVTVGHPSTKNGGFLSANSPDTLTKWSVGRIFNAAVVAGTLRGEAWIEVARANKVYPGLIDSIKNGENLDVSTGYFCDMIEKPGVLHGKEYTVIHQNIRPDHLALLPDEEGACNWADGCGVRANKGTVMKDKLKDLLVNVRDTLTKGLEAIAAPAPIMTNIATDPALLDTVKRAAAEEAVVEKLKVIANARGKDDDPRQMLADLISSNKSPFLPDDLYALQSMHPDTLKHFAELYCPPKGGKSNAVANTGEENVKPEEIQALVDNAVAKAVAAVTANAKPAELSAEDKAALAAAATIVKNARAALEDKVVANTSLKKEQLATFTDAQLETLLAGIPAPAPVGNYSARAFARADQGEGDEDMSAPNLAANFNKKEAA